jgi:Protein of unknown function (DUF3618)
MTVPAVIPEILGAPARRAAGGVIYGVFPKDPTGTGGVVARDPDTIQQEIEKARDALAESLDVLSERASPKRFVEQGRASLQQRLADPKIKYGLIALGVVIAAAVLRKLFR